MFNEGDIAGRINAGFRAGPTELGIPAVFASFGVGKELYDAYVAGRAPTVRLETSGENIEHLYPQVVAETRRGNPNHVVLAGAHLDSVPAGPGHQRRRLGYARGSSSSPSRSPSSARSRSTRSASCGSAVRRTG